MKIFFHGHAFLELQFLNYSVLIDPFVTGNNLCDISLDEICKKNISHIIITHGHSDHIGDSIEIIKKTGAKIISTFEVVQYFFKYHQITTGYSMHIGGTHDFGDFKVKFVNAVHGGVIGPEMLPGKAAGVIIFTSEVCFYHAGDTALHYDMKLLQDFKLDIAFLPIGDNFTMGIHDAAKAVELIKPKMVVPIHYNTFNTIKQNPNKFCELINLSNISTCKVLSPGDYLSFD